MLVFLLPLILFYEVASFTRPERVIAFDVMRHFFELFGPVGMWTPGLAVIAILLATHAFSGEPWEVHWRRVAKMYPESLLLALPLLLFSWAVPLIATRHGAAALFDRAALGIGAGIYEELVFRLILISVILMIGADLFRCDRNKVVIFAVVASSLLFAAHHHPPIGTDPFDPVRFVFRAVSGAYLAAIFWFRGYALAAGCHAAYNVLLAIISTLAYSNPPV
jgi:membrane protease YdiL (CAAX protease family)